VEDLGGGGRFQESKMSEGGGRTRRDKVLSWATFITLLLLLTMLSVVLLYNYTGRVFPLLVVKSGSMEPTLMVGDVILIDENVKPEDIRTGFNGDVIVFYKPGSDELIVHRAVARLDGGFLTKGDANPGTDFWSPVPPENIVGRWTGFRIPYWTGIGYASLFLRGEIYPPYGRILLIALIVLNVAFLIRDLTLGRGKED